ncbi:uracil-DNA glycosylase [Sporosarcina oncorhynchi]|uniref:Uracil-DNA glycosylase n=1 Tax=Sporosarcina oncorhynchi TaxID=3056444 RepID=A0ABZ0L5G8_9BACL|nr:uracil-DNA glycosylase [Sporosarcina sp. T2O-4]WOV87819.1 uracil-DNA glycosylase [Sporosarcina sp. T2O-4]
MTSFCPEIWPEDTTPAIELDCQDCGLYQQGTRMIWGEGNPKAPIMVILDNPGAREDREGNTMVCGTRQTLQQAVHEVGLSKDQIYVTYILKRRPVRAYDKEQTRDICMHRHLDEQLKLQKPALILCLGNVAVQSFFENTEVDVKSLRGSWHEVKGYQTTVAYHPLAIRRRPNLYTLFLEDFTFVADKLVNNKYTF